MSAQRGTIFVESSRVLSHKHLAAAQHILRLQAPRTAARAVPGSFIHLQCQAQRPMRRPFSILRADATAGWIDVLYKEVGEGSRLLATAAEGTELNLLGPIGNGFKPDRARPRVLALGGGVGIPPMIFLADWLRQDTASGWQPLVLMGSEIPFPFQTRPSSLMIPGMPDGVIACMPLLEEWGVPSRLTSRAGFPGCYDGWITELAARWLDALAKPLHQEVEIFACGPSPMLRACAELAARYNIPAQLSLEEYMACAVGGCAGCAVPVHTTQGLRMKRVCVDGPVFAADEVYPPSRS